MDTQSKQEVIVLCGIACTGKSTYIENKLGGENNCFVISDDDITYKVVEEYNKNKPTKLKITYNEVFKSPNNEETIGSIHKKYGEVIQISTIEQKKYKMVSNIVYKKIFYIRKKEYQVLEDRIKNGLKQNKPIVIDMPNLTSEDRIQNIKLIEDINLSYKNKQLEYKHVVIIYGSDLETVKSLNEIRRDKLKAEGIHKAIPNEVLDMMHSKYRLPVSGVEEYCTNVIRIDNSESLKRFKVIEDSKKYKLAYLSMKANNVKASEIKRFLEEHGLSEKDFFKYVSQFKNSKQKQERKVHKISC